MKKYKSSILLAILLLTLLTSCIPQSQEQKVRKLTEKCLEGKIPADSISCLTEVIKQDPNNYEAHVMMANVYKLQVDYPNAITYLQKAVTIKPDDPKAYEELGGYYLFLKQTDKVIENYEKAIALGSEAPSTYFNIALAYAQKGDKEKVKFYLTKAKALDPKLANDVEEFIKQIDNKN